MQNNFLFSKNEKNNKSQKFCQKCEKEITQGKEIKFEQVLEWQAHYSGSRYKQDTYSPSQTATYYLCFDCFELVKQEIIKGEKKWNKWWIIVWLLIIIGIIILVVLVWTGKVK